MDLPGIQNSFGSLKNQLEGDLYFDQSSTDEAMKRVYATDASVYQEKPLAVAIPKDKEDIKKLIRFSRQHQLTLIPRAAGTSLAGQVVGKGIVVDISKYFDKVIEVNVEERWARVQPGVIRDDLNVYLRSYGLMFGPETSTASRAMIGGMIGNNSCGLHSIVWGDTRSHLISAQVLLSDGSEAEFGQISPVEVQEKASLASLEGIIYQNMSKIIGDPQNRAIIENNYPKKSLTRRNTGYALDILASEYPPLNLCRILAGSEGTLAFVTEAKLNLMPLPPKLQGLVCIHCTSIAESLMANLVALRHKPMASELVDKYILDFTKGHPVYEHNRFFIHGDPEAILMVEFMDDDESVITQKAGALVADLQKAGLGYAYPVVTGDQVKLAWDVRKAGLGLIRNMPGNDQPVNLIEDCAVSPEDLPAYIADLQGVLKMHGLKASYYAHAGAGELHVEPIINLKTREGQTVFREVLRETAHLVKKYNGSLSGEHGDGRLRGEYIPTVLGNDVFALIQKVKHLFDPKGVFNANKIVSAPPMDESLRFVPDQPASHIHTWFDFSREEGILRLSEKCSGSGDCRKTHLSGGTMCPSFMATRDEKHTTRARANILRQFLTENHSKNPFDHREIKEVMDLCISCKACKSECPSRVDVAKMKAEFLQHYFDAQGIPVRSWLVANLTKVQQMALMFPQLYNLLIRNKLTGMAIKKILGFAPARSLPKVGNVSFSHWMEKWKKADHIQGPKKGKVVLFCDEFTNYHDIEIGKAAVKLLSSLGYEIMMPKHLESGRTFISKGMLRKAGVVANQNIKLLSGLIDRDTPLVGLEPSAILSFRDEYPDLATPSQLDGAKHLAENSYLLEEFLVMEAEMGNIVPEQFSQKEQHIVLHGHCYQKAMNAIDATRKILSLPTNYIVESIPSGCCGMAGSFGYEKEHYEISMRIGELVLFPAVRKQLGSTIIAAPGTSCRQQIKDGTGREAFHPAEILWNALEKTDQISSRETNIPVRHSESKS